MTAKEIKAVRVVCGFTDDLRISLPWRHDVVTPQAAAIERELMAHLVDLFGPNYPDRAGAAGLWVPHPSTAEEGESNRQILRWVESQVRQVCQGDPMD